MPLHRHTRSLTASEGRFLRLRRSAIRSQRRRVLARTVAAAIIGGALLCLVTLLASNASRTSVIGFWLVISGALAGWAAFDAHRSLRAIAQRVESALRADRVDEVVIEASQFVSFEEASDEGACYAFEVAPDQVIFVSGQDFYPSARFPCTSFALAHIQSETGATIDILIEKHGPKVAPVRVLPASAKATLRIPDHLAVVTSSVATLESALAA